MKNTKLLAMTECAVMLALSFVLNLIVIWQMPLGGKITLVSMLPVMLIGIKWGPKWGFITTGAYAVLQTALSFAKVLGWGLDAKTFIICILFDYFLPYALLGVVAFFRNGKPALWMAGVGLGIALRFVCHFVTGITIWANWVEDAPGAIISYSLFYNGEYMLPELVFTLIVAGILFGVPQFRKMITPKEC